MAAPTVVRIESTQDTTSVLFPNISTLSTAAVGDLCVIYQIGQNTTGTRTSPVYNDNSADAGFTFDGSQFVSGASQIVVYHKVLVSGDFSGGNLRQFKVSYAAFASTGRRTEGMIFHHPNGWDSTIYAQVKSNANVADGSTFALTDSTRAVVAIAGWRWGSATAQPKIAWDGATAITPYVDNSSSTQTDGVAGHHYGNNGLNTLALDFKLYDTSDTPSTFGWDSGQSNTAHAIYTVEFESGAASTITGTASLSGGGTFTASGTPTVNGTTSVAGGGVLTASGTPTVKGTAALAGGGVLSATQQGATHGTASLAGGGTFAARQAKRGTASGSGGGVLAARASVVGFAAIVAGGAFRAEGIVGAIPLADAGEWQQGSQVPPNNVWSNATASATATSTFAAAGIKSSHGFGTPELIDVVRLQSSGTTIVTGTAVLLGSGGFEITYLATGLTLSAAATLLSLGHVSPRIGQRATISSSDVADIHARTAARIAD